jgi:hypothetical protein
MDAKIRDGSYDWNTYQGKVGKALLQKVADVEREEHVDIHKNVREELDSRATYDYDYSQWRCADLLKFPFCCCNSKPCSKARRARQDLHDDNVSRLSSELDIANMVQAQRISKFVEVTHLSKTQRFFVNKFRKYHIDDEIEENEI